MVLERPAHICAVMHCSSGVSGKAIATITGVAGSSQELHHEIACHTICKPPTSPEALHMLPLQLALPMLALQLTRISLSTTASVLLPCQRHPQQDVSPLPAVKVGLVCAQTKIQSEQAQLLEHVHPSVRYAPSTAARQIASALHCTLHAERQRNSRCTDTELRCAGLRRRTCQQLLHYGQVCRIRVRLELREQCGVEPALVRQRLPARRRQHGQLHSSRC